MSMAKRCTFLIASLLLSGMAIAQSQQGIRDQIFGETDVVKKQADELNAKMLAPEAYAEGLELYNSAGETLAKGKDLERVRRDVGEAKGHFARSVEAAKLAHVTFANALSARAGAQKVEADRLVAKDWNRAEQSLLAAAETLESGNLKKAGDSAIDAEKAYRAVEAKAIHAKASGKK
jgi:hypothetical protein